MTFFAHGGISIKFSVLYVLTTYYEMKLQDKNFTQFEHVDDGWISHTLVVNAMLLKVECDDGFEWAKNDSLFVVNGS